MRFSAAIDGWNAASDSSGQKIQYFLELDQSTLNSNCTLPIVNAPTPNACASANLRSAINATPPVGWIDEIKIPLSTANSMSPAGLKGAVAHELGHALGLGGSAGACCPAHAQTTSNYSIMGAAYGGCSFMYTSSVQARDVGQVRAQFSNSPVNCTRTFNDNFDLVEACADSCDDPACPGFDEVLCANSSQTNDECIEEGSCFSVWEVTSYYLCNGSGCEYLYSDWNFIGFECNVLFDPCG